jgi:transposase
MTRKLTKDQRVFLLQTWWKTNKKSQEVNAAFTEKFLGRQAIYNRNTRFEETGSVADLPRSGRPRSARSKENLQTVVQAFVQSPSKSIRRASRELEISRSSLHLMLHTLQFKPYRPHLLHALNDDD